jgi:hypothetical protein
MRHAIFPYCDLPVCTRIGAVSLRAGEEWMMGYRPETALSRIGPVKKNSAMPER